MVFSWAAPNCIIHNIRLDGGISAEYSMLLVSFHLQRHMGNFLIQVYGPCVLLVVLSWVSFWLNREATADRVSLGKSLQLIETVTYLICFRHNHRTNNDIPWSGSKNRLTQSSLSHSTWFLRIPVIFLHLRNYYSGKKH